MQYNHPVKILIFIINILHKHYHTKISKVQIVIFDEMSTASKTEHKLRKEPYIVRSQAIAYGIKSQTKSFLV